jgi:triacylglycerol lipase
MSDCVIFIKAQVGPQRGMKSIESALQEHRYTIVNRFYPNGVENITNVAKQLYDLVCAHAEVHTRIHFVTYSVGSLILRRLLRLYELDTIIGCSVMAAPANHPDAVARLMRKYPDVKKFLSPLGKGGVEPAYLEKICSIPRKNLMVAAGRGRVSLSNPVFAFRSQFSGDPNDGLVTVAETKLPEMELFLEVAETHKSIVDNHTVISETVKFIKDHSGAAHTGVNDIYTTILLSIREDRALLAALGHADRNQEKTSGGGVFWRDLAVVSGWRFQENSMTAQCRILDPNNTALAWASRAHILETYNGLTTQRDF